MVLGVTWCWPVLVAAQPAEPRVETPSDPQASPQPEAPSDNDDSAVSERQSPGVAEPAGALQAAESPPGNEMEPADDPPDGGLKDITEVSLDDLLTTELEIFALGEDLLQLVVTGVSKKAEKVVEAPATVTVITRKDFERHGWQNVAEALRSVPGIFVSWGRDYYYTGVRGISFPRDVDTRILVLLDGHTMNNPWSASSNTGELFTVPPQNIERVEIIRGPASSIYGSNAFLAVVNIVTRSAGEEAGTQAAGEVGANSHGLLRYVASAQHRFEDGPSASLFAVAIGGNGPSVSFEDMTLPRLNRGQVTPTDGVTRDTDYLRGYNLGGRFNFKGISLHLQWRDRFKGLPTARNDAIFDDNYNALRDSHFLSEVRYEFQLGEHDVVLRLHYDRFRSRQFLHRDPTDWQADRWTTGDPHTVSEGNDDTVGAEAQLTLALHEIDTLIAGLQFQWNRVTQPTYELVVQGETQREELIVGKPHPDTIFGGIRDPVTGAIEPVSYWNVAGYLQNDLRPMEGLSLVAGLRYDFNSIFSQEPEADPSLPSPATNGVPRVLQGFAPRAAVIYSPLDWLTLKILYGEAFRYPSIFEAFFDDGASVCGNNQTGPERLRTLELATSVQPMSALTLSGSLFVTRMTDLLVKEPIEQCYENSGPRTRFVNRGSVRVVGGELSADLRLQRDITAFANLGLNRVRQEARALASARAPNSPAVTVSFGFSAPLWEDKLFTSLRGQLIAPRLNWTLDENNSEVAYLRLDHSLVLRHILGSLSATATVTNLLNSRYRDPVTSSETIPTAVPQDGIGFMGTVSYDF